MKNYDYVNELMQHEKSLLVTRSSRIIRNFLTQQIENSDGGITYMEWLVLGIVSRGPKKGLTVSEVAGLIDVTLPQITATTTKLVEHKLVQQRVETKDRRTRRIVATRKGHIFIKEQEERVTKTIREWLYSRTGLTQDDMNIFFYVLNQVASIEADGKVGNTLLSQLRH